MLRISFLLITLVTASASAYIGAGDSSSGGGTVSAPNSQQELTIYRLLRGQSEARYRVRERLAGLEFPNDAVGITNEVSGSIALDEAGAVVAAASVIEIDLRTFASDKERRDRYLRVNTLDTETYPKAGFAITELRGVPWPIPLEGELSVEIVGDLTLRGVTREAVWEADLSFSEGRITGQARTTLTFAEFELGKPSLARLLSVADEIRLELDLVLELQR